ncbi:hypothetical protein Tco_0799775 [Tanacetum coccineum]|uniref:Uncharacterized protein n=1 Tax=Tanacetum coccineum TaxID=301880 RepID=A0ABQ4ZS99_9ASTR
MSILSLRPCMCASAALLEWRAFWSLNKDILKINDSDYQYAVSIKEDTAYPCLHSPKTTKETSSIRRIQRRPIRRIEDIVCEDSGRYQACPPNHNCAVSQAEKFNILTVRIRLELTVETCEELERELRADKDTIERILKEKDKIQSDFFKIENEKIIIQHETQLAKKAFKERENRYLEDIVDLEEKLSYKNLEGLKKAIAAQPKMYDGERLHSAKLTIDSPDSEGTLEDAEES